MDLFAVMTVLALIAFGIYGLRRRAALRRLDEDEELESALPDDHRERDSAWESSLSDFERSEGDDDADEDERQTRS